MGIKGALDLKVDRSKIKESDLRLDARTNGLFLSAFINCPQASVTPWSPYLESADGYIEIPQWY